VDQSGCQIFLFDSEFLFLALFQRPTASKYGRSFQGEVVTFISVFDSIRDIFEAQFINKIRTKLRWNASIHLSWFFFHINRFILVIATVCSRRLWMFWAASKRKAICSTASDFLLICDLALKFCYRGLKCGRKALFQSIISRK
jgi:hypothetical protein